MPALKEDLRYGLLGIPLAFAGLPLYVHIPQFYADLFHIDLAVLGAVLLALRLVDALTDPVIGVVSDRYVKRFGFVVVGAGLVLICSYAALFNPASSLQTPLLWLTTCLVVVYLSYSALMINYYALGSKLAPAYHDQTRLAVFREGCMLIGVLLASLLPTLLGQFTEPSHAYRLFGLLLAPIFVVCAAGCLTLRPPQEQTEPSIPIFRLLKQRPQIRWVLGLALINAVPSAITSTLFLFFTRDVLGEEKWSGPLLALYFLSAAVGMPGWSYLSRKYGKRFSLLGAMAVAASCFVWAGTLHSGQTIYFALICFLSGLTLGADVVMVPSLLSDTLEHARQSSASVFGMWNFVNKLTMGLGAGIVLPILGFAGYRSGAGNSAHALHMLSLCYALVPCSFKASAFLLLCFSPIDLEKSHVR